MSKDEVFNKIKPIFSSIFRVELDKIKYESRRNEFDAWDSLTHLMLIMNIEQTMSVKFNIESIADLNSISSIVNKISKQLNN